MSEIDDTVYDTRTEGAAALAANQDLGYEGFVLVRLVPDGPRR
jgi:hypothetical protein